MTRGKPKQLAAICSMCGSMFERGNNHHRLCLECGSRGARQSRSYQAQASRGLSTNDASIRNWIGPSDRNMQSSGWAVCFDFPFSIVASKNFMYGRGNANVYKKKQTQEYLNALSLKVREQTRGLKVCQNKVWLDLFVQKPTHRSDAINVIDGVCDAIKVGLGIDDNWFCIRQLDWEIAKRDPSIFITISQPDTLDVKACVHCGRLRPLDEFTKDSRSQFGKGKSCLECRGVRVTIKPAEGKAA